MTETILHDVDASSHSLYLTGPGNFRKTLTPTYKANRVGKIPPKHLNAIREFLITQWDAEMCTGYEADDAMGMNQREDTIICSLDKDMLQVPGRHWNWVKQQESVITFDEGLKHFYKQTLIGDKADNITGVVGIGQIKSENILSSVDPSMYYSVCRELYNDDERFHLNCKLLWIWRKENDVWTPPLADEV